MITATINRTTQAQIERAGQALAFGPMHFNSLSEQAVRDYCERLARNDGIDAPQIIIESN